MTFLSAKESRISSGPDPEVGGGAPGSSAPLASLYSVTSQSSPLAALPLVSEEGYSEDEDIGERFSFQFKFRNYAHLVY